MCIINDFTYAYVVIIPYYKNSQLRVYLFLYTFVSVGVVILFEFGHIIYDLLWPDLGPSTSTLMTDEYEYMAKS